MVLRIGRATPCAGMAAEALTRLGFGMVGQRAMHGGATNRGFPAHGRACERLFNCSTVPGAEAPKRQFNSSGGGTVIRLLRREKALDPFGRTGSRAKWTALFPVGAVHGRAHQSRCNAACMRRPSEHPLALGCNVGIESRQCQSASPFSSCWWPRSRPPARLMVRSGSF